MLTSIVVAIVKACTRFAVSTVLVGAILAVAAGFYTAHHFKINTDINTLISPDLDWRKRDNQFEKAFDRERTILAVVEAPTPELTSSAAKALFDEASRATWKNTADVKRRYATASIVSAERIVFNIKGNDYRLVVAVDFEKAIIWIKWIGSHRAYDTIDVTKVRHDN